MTEDTNSTVYPLTILWKEELVAWIDFDGVYHVAEGTDPKLIADILMGKTEVTV